MRALALLLLLGALAAPAPSAADVIGRPPRKSECTAHSDCGDGKFCSFSYWIGHGWRSSRTSTCRPCNKCAACHYHYGYHCTYTKCNSCGTSVDGKSKCEARCGGGGGGGGGRKQGPCTKQLAHSGPPTIGQHVPQCDAKGNFEAWQCAGLKCWSVDPSTGRRLKKCRGLATEMKVIAKHCCGKNMGRCHGQSGIPSRCNGKCSGVFEDVFSRCETEMSNSLSYAKYASFRTMCDAGEFNDGKDNDNSLVGGGH